MPKQSWDSIVTIFALVLAFGTEFADYEYIGPATGLSKNELRLGMFGVFVLISVALYWYFRRAEKGRITATGLERENWPAILLEGVERIASEGWGFPAVIFLIDGRVNMHIPRSDLVRLAKTRLNQWTIGDRDMITVTPGKTGQELQISYSARGMYDIYKFAQLSICFLFLISAPILSDAFGFINWLIALLILIAVLLILPHYDPVEASVAGDKVSWKLYTKEESFRLSDVTGLERGLFHIRVTIKNGDVFRVPRVFVLLPELIAEFAAPSPAANEP